MTIQKIAAASNGRAAVAVVNTSAGPVCLKYAPSSVGSWDRREEFAQLFNRAVAKLEAKNV